MVVYISAQHYKLHVLQNMPQQDRHIWLFGQSVNMDLGLVELYIAAG